MCNCNQNDNESQSQSQFTFSQSNNNLDNNSKCCCGNNSSSYGNRKNPLLKARSLGLPSAKLGKSLGFNQARRSGADEISKKSCSRAYSSTS